MIFEVLNKKLSYREDQQKHKKMIEEYVEQYDGSMYSFVSDPEVLGVLDNWRKKEPVLHFARWMKLDMSPKSKLDMSKNWT